MSSETANQEELRLLDELTGLERYQLEQQQMQMQTGEASSVISGMNVENGLTIEGDELQALLDSCFGTAQATADNTSAQTTCNPMAIAPAGLWDTSSMVGVF